jgi:HlyD family secretion protein
MASRKLRIGLVVVGLVVLAVVVGVSVGRDARSRVAVQTDHVGRRDLTSTVSASGEIKPKRYVNVSANVSGRITRLLVKEGERVKSGQVLARIDSTRFEAGARQSEAAVQSARADLQRTQADMDITKLAYDRAQRMRTEKLISDQQFDQADADLKMKIAGVESQRRRITQLEAALASQADDLEKTVVVSPMDGVVTNLAKEEGEVVIGAQSFQPTVLMTVGDLSVMEVEVLVDETDIRNLALGQDAEVRVDALEGLKVKGSVTEIGSSAIPRGGAVAGQSSANQAKDFKVTVTLENPPSTLRPGLNATADIITAKKTSVVAVPIQAVVVREVGKDGKIVEHEDNSGAKPGEPTSTVPRTKGEEKDGVFVVQNREAHFHPVKTGIVGETDMEVVEGLKEGDEIVTGSYKTLRTLRDEAKIKPEEKHKGEKS